MIAQGGWKHLVDDMVHIGPEWTSLVWPLTPGSDPDDAFSSVPYEKGFALLAYLESLVGEPDFKVFVKAYIAKFQFGTLTSGEFRDFFCEHFQGRDAIAGLDWNTLLTAPGLPAHPSVDLSNRLSDAAHSLVQSVVDMNTYQSYNSSKLVSIQVCYHSALAFPSSPSDSLP